MVVMMLVQSLYCAPLEKFGTQEQKVGARAAADGAVCIRGTRMLTLLLSVGATPDAVRERPEARLLRLERAWERQ